MDLRQNSLSREHEAKLLEEQVTDRRRAVTRDELQCKNREKALQAVTDGVLSSLATGLHSPVAAASGLAPWMMFEPHNF